MYSESLPLLSQHLLIHISERDAKWFSFYTNNLQKSDCPGSFQHSIPFFVVFYFSSVSCHNCLLAFADVSNISSNMSETENTFTLCFLIGVIIIFFYPTSYSLEWCSNLRSAAGWQADIHGSYSDPVAFTQETDGPR